MCICPGYAWHRGGRLRSTPPLTESRSWSRASMSICRHTRHYESRTGPCPMSTPFDRGPPTPCIRILARDPLPLGSWKTRCSDQPAGRGLQALCPLKSFSCSALLQFYFAPSPYSPYYCLGASIFRKAQVETDFSPSRWLIAPFHTAKATGTIFPGANSTASAPLAMALEKLTRHLPSLQTPFPFTFWESWVVNVPNPAAARFSTDTRPFFSPSAFHCQMFTGPCVSPMRYGGSGWPAP